MYESLWLTLYSRKNSQDMYEFLLKLVYDRVAKDDFCALNYFLIIFCYADIYSNAGLIFIYTSITARQSDNMTEDEIDQWLDSKPHESVLYLTF